MDFLDEIKEEAIPKFDSSILDAVMDSTKNIPVTLEEKRLYMKKAFIACMLYEYGDDKNVKFLSELYEFAFPKDNFALTERLEFYEISWISDGGIYDHLYQSMIFLLAERIVLDDALANMFINHYMRYYKADVEIAINHAINHDIEIAELHYKGRCGRIARLLEDDDLVKREVIHFAYLYYVKESEIQVPFRVWDEYYDEILKKPTLSETVLVAYNEMATMKMDWTDNFLESDTYKKYIKKQRQELAKSQNITEDELFEKMKKDRNNEVIFTFLTGEILKKYNVKITELIKTIHEMKTEDCFIDYEERVELFYRIRVLRYLATLTCEKESLSKLDVLRYMPEPVYAEDYKLILFSKDLDELVCMYKRLKKEFYLNFSFDKISNMSLKERYAAIIKQYEGESQKQHDIFLQIQDENFRLKKLIAKKDFAENQKDYIQSLEEDLKKKESDIDSLKQQLNQQQAYIDLLLVEDEEKEEVYDIDVLHTKKYMFVGHDGTLMNEIKKTFPNSVFLTHNTANIDNVQVDAIVYVIKRMSHALFYKVQAKYQQTEIPVIKYNGKNMRSLLGLMYKEISEFYK